MAFHVTSRLYDSRNLTPTVEDARRLSSILLGFASDYDVMLFSCAGDHIHTVTLADRPKAGRLTRALEAAITLVCGHDPGFRPGRIRKVRGEHHLEELVDYTLGQHAKHDVVGDTLLESSNLLDLLSIRLVDTASATLLKEKLPRTTREQLAKHIGGYPQPGTDLTRLRDACAVVTGGLPLLGRSPLATRARLGAIRVARESGLSAKATATLMDVGRTTVARAKTELDTEMDRSIALALGLVQARAPSGFPDRITLPRRVTWLRPDPSESIRARLR